MAAEIITTEDLHLFKQELLGSLKEFLSNHHPPPPVKWMKTAEVRKLLRISNSTLQNLRNNGKLPYTKIGGVIYYTYEDILKLMAANKKNTY